MVRPANVARSRACNQCKKKRVKCDLTSPACQQCIQSRLPCSGPLSGLLMVNSGPSTFAAGTSRRPPIASSAPISPTPATAPARVPAPDMVLYRAPSPASIYEDALLWAFLGAYFPKSASHIWDAKLPYLRSAKNAAAMKTAAKAVSLAFAAHSLNDLTMAATACEFYGQSLHFHQRSFVAPRGRKICHKKAVNALPVTVLLSYFEIIQPTSVDAWIRHIAAAEQLFILMGPDALRDDLLNHLYFLVKSNSLISCFLTGSKTQLFGQPWSDIDANRLRDRSNVLYNDLLELIARLSDQFATTDRLDNNLSMHDQLTKLSELYTTFENSKGLETTSFPWVRSHYGFDSIQSEQDIPDIILQLQDPNVCMAAAYFHAAAILLLTLLQRTDSEEWTHDDISNFKTYHSIQVLSCAKHLATIGYGYSRQRMILPVAVVDRCSPVQQHRTLARTMYTTLITANGLSGIYSVVGKNLIEMAKMMIAMPV